MKKSSILKIILPLMTFATIFLLWQMFSYYEIINPFLFSNPTKILISGLKIKELYLHIFSSLYRLFFSILYGYVSGVLFGIIIYNFKFFSFLKFIINFLMSIPGIAWAPLFIIFTGFGNVTIIIVGAIAAFFPSVFNTLQGLKNIDNNYLKLSQLLELNKKEQLKNIYLPAIGIYLINAIRESFSRAWRTIIAVEMIAASNYGLGYITFDARELLNIDVMYLGIFLSGLIYILIDFLFVRIIENKTVVKWGLKRKYEKI